MASHPAAVAARRDGRKAIGLIGTGHFFSHFYILVLPPLFPLLRGEYGVSYTALGAALAVLNVTTALTQAPCGFLVDRFGARWILIGGLALFALATALIGVFPSFPALLALMVLAGLGNSVFHPADYAILSASVEPERMGRAFSIHTFGGYFGFAAAPVTVVFLTELVGWRLALTVCGLLGLGVALLMVVFGAALRDERDAGQERRAGGAGTRADIRLLLGPPILMALLFFIMLALSHGGMTSYGVSALEAWYRVPLVEANLPISAYLFASAVGVLAGGWIADGVHRQDRLVAAYMILGAIAVGLVALLKPPILVTAALCGVAGFLFGALAPSRDLMLRAITPPGASGRVFGFVTTGFNIGAIVTPLLFGVALDLGRPSLVFALVAALSVLTVVTVITTGRHAQQALAAGGD